MSLSGDELISRDSGEAKSSTLDQDSPKELLENLIQNPKTRNALLLAGAAIAIMVIVSLPGGKKQTIEVSTSDRRN